MGRDKIMNPWADYSNVENKEKLKEMVINYFEDQWRNSKMTYNIYSIQDTLVGFTDPFIRVNDSVAKREYANFLKSPRCTNPSDMRLYKIGTFEESTGTVIGTPAIEMIAGGGDDEGNL